MILEKNYLNKTYICDPTLPQTLLDSYNMNIYAQTTSMTSRTALKILPAQLHCDGSVTLVFNSQTLTIVFRLCS